jgi:hypothetical protein
MTIAAKEGAKPMDVLTPNKEFSKLARDGQTGRTGQDPLDQQSMNTVWMLKACPRCGGDLHRVQYLEGAAVKCLQCAREWDSLPAAQEISHKTGDIFQGRSATKAAR